MSGKYVDDGKDLFLIREFRENETEHMALRMLGSYAPKGLLPVRFRRETDRITAQYRVSGLLSLTEAMKDSDQETILRAVTAAISDIGPVLQAYFLSLGQLSLEPSEIFLDTRKSVHFLYLLSAERNFQQSLQSLMEFFLRKMNPREEDRVLLLYGLYQKSREETVGSDSLFRYYQEWEKNRSPKYEASGTEAGTVFQERGNNDYVPDIYAPASGWNDSGAFYGWTSEDAEPPVPDTGQRDTAHSPFYEREGAEMPDDPIAPVSDHFWEKLKEFVKKHRYDLLIALIILIGVILFILI